MPGMSGLALQDSLAQAGGALPMVFITGHGDIPTTVRAMKGGAVNFLPKPFAEREILAAVAEALERSRAIERERRETGSLRARYEALTAREQEVLALVVAGLLNKVIADRLGIQESTIKVHRGRVMEKMAAASVADLVRMSERLGLAPAADPARG
jgi:FixJ family two-component response regulator